MTIGLLPNASRTLPDARPDAAERPPDARPNAVKPGFHCARSHWIRGFIAFQRAAGLGGRVAPVVSAQFLRERYDAVTIG